MPPRHAGKIRRPRNDRRRASRLVLRTRFFFRRDAAPLENAARDRSRCSRAENDAWSGVREWGTGQAVQLRASMERIAWRAKGKNWPEYSELQCFACHHSLTAPEQSWRQERGYAGRRPGDPPWNASRYAVFRELAHQVDNDAASRLNEQVSQLAKVAQPVESRPRSGCCGLGKRRRTFRINSLRGLRRSLTTRR